MIRTWIAEVTPLLEKSVYRKCYEKLPTFRKEKADRIVPEADRALSVGAWLLYECVRKECGVSAETPFNLSHSGKMVLCSIEDSGEKEIKIGCDIEEIKKLHTKLIKRYFFKSEENFILSKPSEEEKKVAFYRYWVLKESFMKATRYGMKMGLDTFEIMCASQKRYANNFILKNMRQTCHTGWRCVRRVMFLRRKWRKWI